MPTYNTVPKVYSAYRITSFESNTSNSHSQRLPWHDHVNARDKPIQVEASGCSDISDVQSAVGSCGKLYIAIILLL